MKKYTTKKALAAAIDDLTPFTAVNEYSKLIRIDLKAARSSSLNTDKNDRFRRSEEWKQIQQLFEKNDPELFATRFQRSIVFTNVTGREY